MRSPPPADRARRSPSRRRHGRDRDGERPGPRPGPSPRKSRPGRCARRRTALAASRSTRPRRPRNARASSSRAGCATRRTFRRRVGPSARRRNGVRASLRTPGPEASMANRGPRGRTAAPAPSDRLRARRSTGRHPRCGEPRGTRALRTAEPSLRERARGPARDGGRGPRSRPPARPWRLPPSEARPEARASPFRLGRRAQAPIRKSRSSSFQVRTCAWEKGSASRTAAPTSCAIAG